MATHSARSVSLARQQASKPKTRTVLVAGRMNWREAGVLILVFGVLLVFWNTWFVYPLKMLVVFFHEASHAAAAIATGGTVSAIIVRSNLGGFCTTAGGNRFLIASAGYLGSLLCGAAILLASARTRHPQAVSTVLGSLLLVVTLLVVRPVLHFGFFFGLVAGAAFIAAAWYVPARWNRYILKAIGLSSCLYAVLDIRDDVFYSGSVASDAHVLHRLTGVPAFLWGAIWIAIALGVSWCLIRSCCRDFLPAQRSKG